VTKIITIIHLIFNSKSFQQHVFHPVQMEGCVCYLVIAFVLLGLLASAVNYGYRR